MSKFLKRKDTLSVDELFSLIEKTPFPWKIKLFDEEVSIHNKRISVYKQKGCKCVSCGLTGKFFAVEKFNKRSPSQNKFETYHLNLYALTRSGKEILMTNDHIIPRSKGGSNDMSNLQPMCFPCNVNKGNKLEVKD